MQKNKRNIFKIKSRYVFIWILFFTLFLFGIYFLTFLNKQIGNGKVLKNIVLVEKKSEIIDNYKNPRGINDKNIFPENILSNGIFIKKDLVLTTSHSVGNFDENYIIITYSGEKINAKLLKKDEQKDLAFLKTVKNFSEFKKIKIIENPEKSLKIRNYFFDVKTKKLGKQIGIILKINQKEIISNLFLKKGSSGSPVFDKDFNLVGINKEFDLNNKTGILSKIGKINF